MGHNALTLKIETAAGRANTIDRVNRCYNCMQNMALQRGTSNELIFMYLSACPTVRIIIKKKKKTVLPLMQNTRCACAYPSTYGTISKYSSHQHVICNGTFLLYRIRTICTTKLTGDQCVCYVLCVV